MLAPFISLLWPLVTSLSLHPCASSGTRSVSIGRLLSSIPVHLSCLSTVTVDASYSTIYLSIFVCIIYVYGGVYVSVGQRSTLDVFFDCSPPHFFFSLRQDLSQSSELTSLVRLAGWQAQETLLSCPAPLAHCKHTLLCLAFYVGARVWTPVCLLV